MDEEGDKETEGKTTEEDKTKKTASGTHDTKNRTAAERKAEIEEREALAKREEELIAREEQIAAKRALGGMSEAGQNKEVSEEDKIKQGAKEFFKGTQLEKDIDNL